MLAQGTIVSSGKQTLGEEKPGVPQSLRFSSRFQPSSQGVQRAIQSSLVKLRSQWRLASKASERHREQSLAKHTFSSEFGDRLLAAHGRCH